MCIRDRAGTWPERQRLDADPAARRRAPAPKPLPVPDAPRSTPKMKRASSGGECPRRSRAGLQQGGESEGTARAARAGDRSRGAPEGHRSATPRAGR
ncbi:hypothetical protein NN561_014363 [Cricetulus griseus]